MRTAGANVNTCDVHGDYPLHSVLQFGLNIHDIHPQKSASFLTRHKSIDLLLKAGANVNVLDKYGFSALHYAIALLLPVQCVEVLVAAGADVNFRDYNGATALTWRIESNKVVKLLLQAGADVNATILHGSKKGQTVLFTKSAYIRRIYLKAGISINIYDSKGFNALQNHILYSSMDPKIGMLLFVAGEKLKPIKSRRKVVQKIPDYLKFEDIKLSLNHMCREAIRKHLIDLDPHAHLFSRIPQLPLPSSVTEYLLYNLTLDEDGDSEDDSKGTVDEEAVDDDAD